MPENPILKYRSTDDGNCRVYYAIGHGVRCFQEDTPGLFTYYVCSRDGEPEAKGTTRLPLDRVPDDDSSTAVAFRQWVDRQRPGC
jgi:hypothetical protein